MARDNFSKKTVTLLAERVGFICSNPKCRIHTVGPNTADDKSTRIGKAAHITAASAGGPRYNSALTESQRRHINNGIWLCSNCSDLIDKDEQKYSPPLLNSWKAQAELEMYEKIESSKKLNNQTDDQPFLEVDLIWTDGGRWVEHSSELNPTTIENGIVVYNMGFNPIYHFKLDWNYFFNIHNNSSKPAYNIRIEPIGDKQFTKIEKLPKVNNLPPFQKTSITATHIQYFEGTGEEAGKITSSKIPTNLDGLRLEIVYYDDARKEHRTIVSIEKQQIINSKT